MTGKGPQIMKRQRTAVSSAVWWEWRTTSWREKSDDNHLWSAKGPQWARQCRGNGGQQAEEREATIITYWGETKKRLDEWVCIASSEKEKQEVKTENNEPNLWSAKGPQWARQYGGNGGQRAEEREATIITYWGETKKRLDEWGKEKEEQYN
jgi:hypothetical protein